MNKRAFYPFNDDEIRLPYTWSDYLDSENAEGLSFDTKLMHLFYVINSGMNIVDEINEYVVEHHKVSSECAKHTLALLVAYMRYGQDKKCNNDCDIAGIVMEDELSLEEMIDLFSIELQMRFSYYEEDDGNIIFSQKYIRCESFRKLQKDKNDDEIKEIIIHPTGYKKISDDIVLEENLWPALIKQYNQMDIYSDVKKHIYPNDENIINAFNEQATSKKTSEQYKYILGVPAEPWQGNPLTAKLIILSLNPGYDEQYNKTEALKLPPQIIEGVWREKAKTLRLSADGFLPLQKDYAKAINVIGAKYWYNRFENIKNDLNKDEDEFYGKIALIQFCAYTSIKYKDFPKREILPSQQLTKDIIRNIVYNHTDTKFVIMRSWQKWRGLLDDDVWYKMRPRLVINTNMSQALTIGNLGDYKYQFIINALK